MVPHGVVDYLWFSFLIARHTKFDADCAFSVQKLLTHKNCSTS